MTAMERDVPSIPLTMGERDTFDRLVAPIRRRCRFCPKRATGVCGCCCPEHDTPPAPRVTRYDTRPTARLRRLARRIARSRFADDVRASVDAAFWPAVICSGLLLGLYLLLLTRGQYVAWDGIHSIPTGGTK